MVTQTKTTKLHTKKSDENKSSKLMSIGTLLLAISPVIFLLLPQLPFFFDIFCGPNAVGDGCGYANIGITGYAFCVAAAPFIMGILLILAGLILKRR